MRWSYSKLSTYETCPAKYKYRHIDGMRDPPTPSMQRGTMLHRLCESVLNEPSAPIPEDLSLVVEHLQRLRTHGAQAEKVWRLDAAWSPVPASGWIKGIVDVHFLKDDELHIYDFKSGHRNTKHKGQLELYALLGLVLYPQAQTAEVGAIYLDAGKVGYVRTITRAEADAARPLWTARAQKMLTDAELQPTPGSHCYRCNFADRNGGPCEAGKYSSRKNPAIPAESPC